MRGDICLLLLIANSFAILGSCVQDDTDGTITFDLQHSFDSGILAEFVPRMTLTVRPFKSSVIQLPKDVQLTDRQRTKLLDLTHNGGIYRLRAPIETRNKTIHLSTFVQACSLYESGLSDILTIHTDGFGEPVSITATTTKPLCDGRSVPLSQLTHFNTAVEIRPIESGPIPDTTAFIQKIEREKAEKAKGEQGDNRSFFAKYWMFFIPVFIFIFISGMANPEAGGR